MSKLSASKVRTPEARRNTSENAHSGMEMGENRNGLRGWSSKDDGKYDSIWVIVDRLTKSAHFILVKVTYNAEKLAKIYISEIVRLHGVPLSIISDRGTQFTSKF